ncbi:PREDICTED: fibroblast growth factor receptor 2-like isoform X2 [Acropora digitifera]|uniref:fibroblast growth factor receptor 2-like isoform X2 n=1 Tax=Acropora digitifera TaxID=70779 RepID=UPI00077A9A6F|nr:PREDICTED: fibroblast growth factor receptor 2-like isoform X2 [Acropora digitifera]XP_015756867.1 PREDICTED: fibroblast growth factor receptor 2-like isoform X2 [Acropora digitifera]
MQATQYWWTLLVNFIINTQSVRPEQYPPRFGKKPKVQNNVQVGHNVRLRCSVKGDPLPRLSWVKDQKPLQFSSRIRLIPRDNGIVKIKNTQLVDAGNYTCIAANSLGTVNATLELHVRQGSSNPFVPTNQAPTARFSGKHAPPSFTDQSFLERRYRAWPASHTIRLKCEATGAPPLQFRWLKDGQRLLSRRMDPYLNSSLWFLRLRDVVPDDSGKYTCIVTNPYGSINHTYTLNVVAKPRSRPFLQSDLPRNTTVKLGDNTTMKCIVLVSGTLPDFRWLKWDKNITSQPKMNGTMKANGSNKLIDPIHYKTIKDGEYHGVQVEIYNVSDNDFGLYTCFVSNHIGYDYNSAFLIKFEERPGPTTSGHNWWESASNFQNGSSTERSLVNAAEERTQVGLVTVIMILVAALLLSATIASIMFLFYRKKLKHNLLQEEKTQADIVRLHEVPDIIEGTSNLLLSEPSTPNQTDQGARTFTYPIARRRLSSSGSINSTTPLLKNRSGSHRSRFSSGVSSRIDSNIAEEFYELPCDEEWEIERSLLTIREQLGEGAFGLVMRADAVGLPDMPTTNSVAVKMLKADATENELADLLSEMDTMKEIGKHKNIINLIGACTQNGPLFVVVEFAPFGNLRQFLRERRPSEYQQARSSGSGGSSLTIRDFVSFAFQIARGMEYLGTKKCVHRDLAARNILVGEDYVMKIADFGLARNVRDLEYYRKTTDGRLPIKWLAIEALFDRVYTTQSDVWAFGILLWEIFTLGGSPYPGIPIEKLFELLKSGYRMQKPQNCPNDIYDIMLNCWDEKQSSRASFTDLRKLFDAMLSSMTSKEYLEILAQSIEDMAVEMSSPIRDDSDNNDDVIIESSC